MTLIDAHLHTSADQREHRPASHLVAMMDAVGVDLAILVQLTNMGTNNAYIMEAAESFSDRFVVVGALDPTLEDQGDLLGRWRDHRHTVGVRLSAASSQARALLLSGGFDTQLGAAEYLGLPVFLFAPNEFREFRRIATAYPELLLVLDHLGLPAPPGMDPGAEPFEALPELLSLAEFPNIALKCSGVPALSARPYPFSDIWSHIHVLLESFGSRRVMWGSDATRVASLHTYREALDHIMEATELSRAEKDLLLGGAARALLGIGDLHGRPG